jgi:hypothetical protein
MGILLINMGEFDILLKDSGFFFCPPITISPLEIKEKRCFLRPQGFLKVEHHQYFIASQPPAFPPRPEGEGRGEGDP